jgi:hypothetical protein
MFEVTILSLFVGSLGIQATLIGTWMRWQQVVLGQQQEEEEVLTRYDTKEDAATLGSAAAAAPRVTTNGSAKAAAKDPRLAGWEFKIVRAHRDLFRDSATLQKLCKEEAESGWIMLEKLDDRRIRFKRPLALREIMKAEFLQHDPYRSYYGPNANPLTWLGTIAALAAIVLPAYLGYSLVTLKFKAQPQSVAPSQPLQSLPSNPSDEEP